VNPLDISLAIIEEKHPFNIFETPKLDVGYGNGIGTGVDMDI